ncbi:MAG: hypothetical protein IID32_01660 [Planctomycetes bacterium]|nr:hypothetical protein [Planctomycetota bacterium]
MDVVIFEDNWQTCFNRLGLQSLDDFMNFSAGEIINQNSRRSVLRFSLGEGDTRKEFFMKRFYKPHTKDRLGTLIHYGKFLSQAGVEWTNAKYLLDHDIETYHPVCYGQRRILGLETHSFIVTEKLKSVPLTHFIMDHWADMDDSERNKMIVSMANLVAKLHHAKINMPDLYMWHFFVSRDKDFNQYEYALIDLHRMTINGHKQYQQSKNIAALFYSMLDDYFDEAAKKLFLETYHPDGYQKLQNKITARVKVIQGRRKEKHVLALWQA